MKKLLALMLCICFCFLTFSCNKVEESNLTEPESIEAEPTEPEPTDPEPTDPEPVKLNINVVEDNKIVFPHKNIKYIKVTWNIGKQENPYSGFFTQYPGDEFIFRRPESISRIVSFFEELSLGEKSGGPSGNAEALVICFYFNGNTYLEFSSASTRFIRVPTGINDKKDPFLSFDFYRCDMSGFREVCGLVGYW